MVDGRVAGWPYRDGVAIGAYPGSFNPPTVAHLAVARAALEQCGLERVDLVLSRDVLGKDRTGLEPIENRITVLTAIAATRDWLDVRVTDARLVVDIAEGYDVIVLGADKWGQVIDPDWYGGSVAARDEMLDRLPHVACAPRPPHPVPTFRGGVPGRAVEVTVLEIHPDHHAVSASDVRAGRRDWMAAEAVAFAEATGAWPVPRDPAPHVEADANADAERNPEGAGQPEAQPNSEPNR